MAQKQKIGKLIPQEVILGVILCQLIQAI